MSAFLNDKGLGYYLSDGGVQWSRVFDAFAYGRKEDVEALLQRPEIKGHLKTTVRRYGLPDSNSQQKVNLLMASLLMAYKELGNYEAKCSIVESLMRLDPTLANVSHLEYGTPLTFAIKLPDPSIAQMMLRLGADPNAPAEEYPESLTPLVVAIESGQYSLAESLLAANADPNIPQSIGGSHTRRSVSVLYVALEKVPLSLFKALLQAGARTDWANYHSGVTSEGVEWETPADSFLHVCATSKHPELCDDDYEQRLILALEYGASTTAMVFKGPEDQHLTEMPLADYLRMPENSTMVGHRMPNFLSALDTYASVDAVAQRLSARPLLESVPEEGPAE